MNLQTEHIGQLCRQLKLERVLAEYATVAQDAVREKAGESSSRLLECMSVSGGRRPPVPMRTLASHWAPGLPVPRGCWIWLASDCRLLEPSATPGACPDIPIGMRPHCN